MLTPARQRRMEVEKETGNVYLFQKLVIVTKLTGAYRGRSGEEVQDYDYSFTNARRRSNSSTQGLADFSTKFEALDPEPVFEEQQHASESSDVTKAEGSSSGHDSEVDQDGLKH